MLVVRSFPRSSAMQVDLIDAIADVSVDRLCASLAALGVPRHRVAKRQHADSVGDRRTTASQPW